MSLDHLASSVINFITLASEDYLEGKTVNGGRPKTVTSLFADNLTRKGLGSPTGNGVHANAGPNGRVSAKNHYAMVKAASAVWKKTPEWQSDLIGACKACNKVCTRLRTRRPRHFAFKHVNYGLRPLGLTFSAPPPPLAASRYHTDRLRGLRHRAGVPRRR